MIDLAADELRIVKEILARHVPRFEVRVFGSRVKESAAAFSDLDLAIVSGNGLDWRDVEALKDAFAASDLRICVDVVDFAAASPVFKQIILERNEIIQTGNAADELQHNPSPEIN